VLTRADLAPSLAERHTIIRGIAYAVTAGYWNTQFDPSWGFTSFRATQEAAKAAYRMAGITDPAREIDVAECHDCFTITEIINYEDLGFARPGEGWKFATSHDQLLGRAGRMQVKDARVGLAHNLGGPGAVSAVAILGQP
jgi:acetyl-CoA C-acetyltransferase